MPYCPQCGAEYIEGIETCADCGAVLAPGSPPVKEPTYSNEPMEIVYEAMDDLHSSLAKRALQEAGIPVFEQIDRHPWYDGVDFSVVGRYSRLRVMESRAEKARQVLADFFRNYEAGNLALPDEPQAPPAEPEDKARRRKF